ncbi:hypothetical protein C9374_004463 [Naegleria lovaniensis]|uniref:Uncharacterized protein n=1 Tax=Naegleria lovaniensis TaxID=51637 RepID=A0AA88GPY2_NAELO|nr:uncharacterized protein C9374_004463 [Naegleria lovaniensis]KAG2383126.1 hypothetical protein C9374_004463 [Naegleria lovaniensis]
MSEPSSVWDLFTDEETFESFDTILDNPSTTLEDILDQDTLLQEVKSLSPKLIQYLTCSKTLRKLIDYITTEQYFEDDIKNNTTSKKKPVNFFDDDFGFDDNFGSQSSDSSTTNGTTATSSIRQQALQAEEKMKQEYLSVSSIKEKLDELSNRPELKTLYQYPYVVAEIFGCCVDKISNALVHQTEDENYQLYGERFLDLLLVKYLLLRKPHQIPKNRSLSQYLFKALNVLMDKPEKYYMDVVKRLMEIVDDRAIPASLNEKVDENLYSSSEVLLESLFVRNIGLCGIDNILLKILGMESSIFQEQTANMQDFGAVGSFSSFASTYSFSVTSNDKFSSDEEEEAPEMKIYKTVQEWAFTKYGLYSSLLRKLSSYISESTNDELLIEIEEEQQNIFSLLSVIIEKALLKRPSYCLPSIEAVLSPENIRTLLDIILKCDTTKGAQNSLFNLGTTFLRHLLSQVISSISAISSMTTIEYANLSSTDLKVLTLGIDALKELTSSSLLTKFVDRLQVVPQVHEIQVLQCGVPLKQPLGESRLLVIEYLTSVFNHCVSLQQSLHNLQKSKNERASELQTTLSSIFTAAKASNISHHIVQFFFQYDFNSLLHKQVYLLVVSICELTISESVTAELKNQLLFEETSLCKRIVEKHENLKNFVGQTFKGTVGMGYLFEMAEVIQTRISQAGSSTNEELQNTLTSLNSTWKPFVDTALKEYISLKEKQLGGSAPIGKPHSNWNVVSEGNSQHMSGLHIDEEDTY